MRNAKAHLESRRFPGPVLCRGQRRRFQVRFWDPRATRESPCRAEAERMMEIFACGAGSARSPERLDRRESEVATSSPSGTFCDNVCVGRVHKRLLLDNRAEGMIQAKRELNGPRQRQSEVNSPGT